MYQLNRFLCCKQDGCNRSEKSSFNREQVGIVNLRAADSHELCQAQQILDVVPRLPLAHSNLSSDLLCAGRPQKNGVVRSGDVQKSLDRRLTVQTFFDKKNPSCSFVVKRVQQEEQR
ncbi:hypothetical protein DNTS_023907 [Danionella cerebrum]|uniref:Uncharacterized protein n=1 Tax=Danionella cerebrum TaxID=2873325 RepID=A0A553MUY7_9TELE|nr:hypothetical protein DNTS_023907 [Danionella translucida]